MSCWSPHNGAEAGLKPIRSSDRLSPAVLIRAKHLSPEAIQSSFFAQYHSTAARYSKSLDRFCDVAQTTNARLPREPVDVAQTHLGDDAILNRVLVVDLQPLVVQLERLRAVSRVYCSGRICC